MSLFRADRAAFTTPDARAAYDLAVPSYFTYDLRPATTIQKNTRILLQYHLIVVAAGVGVDSRGEVCMVR